MNRFTCFLIVLFGGIFSMYSQTFQVQGKVTDDQNIPLIGVNVLVKNAARGTTTDFDGNYSLNPHCSPNVKNRYKSVKKRVVLGVDWGKKP